MPRHFIDLFDLTSTPGLGTALVARLRTGDAQVAPPGAVEVGAVCVPVAGYIGISLFPALDIFGLFSLPGVVPPDKEAAKTVFFVHGLLVRLLVLLILVHVCAALFHYFIRKDNVLGRMIPGLLRRR